MTANPSLTCRGERRRRKVRHEGLNGIESIEVREGHRVLTVSLLDRAPENLTAANVRIDGGRRITGIRVLDVHIRNGTDRDLDRELDITLDRPGDLSTYTLSFVKVDEHGHPGTEPQCANTSIESGCSGRMTGSRPVDRRAARQGYTSRRRRHDSTVSL